MNLNRSPLILTMLFASVGALLLYGGCAPKDVLIIDVAPAPDLPPALPGVDSVFAAMANAYAQRSHMVDDRALEDGRRAVAGGRRLFEIADSLTSGLKSSPDSVLVSDDQVAESIRRYNEGARVLQNDELGMAELQSAAEQFQLALDANPYDTEALYWLSRVYELQADRMAEAGAVEDQVEVLKRLTELYPLRHDYAGLLAAAYEKLGTAKGWSEAGAWWHRSALLVQDEPALSLDADAVLDTATTFIALANASRAFIESDQGDLALAAIEEAVPFAVGEEARIYLRSEREWLTWDTELQSRKDFDDILGVSQTDPNKAASGLQELLPRVSLPLARIEVQYQLGLALYNGGDFSAGVTELQSVWQNVATIDIPLRERIQEDYGLMTYSIALEQREAGQLRNALAYLLQSESTGFSGAAVSSLTRSLLLRNDPEASLDAAELAERGWEKLDEQDQRTLLQHMVDLHRRLENREEALEYARRYREMAK